MRIKSKSLVAGVALVAFPLLSAGPALADKIKHPIAIFAGLDKITGRIISFEVSIDETVQFGSLHVTPRVCFTRPPTEAPHTTGFVEVEEIEKENQFKKIFSGWMFAASPGLSAAEHPVYDVWLTDCKGGTEIIREAKAVEETPPDTNLPLTTTMPAAPERPQRAARPQNPADPNALPGANPNALPGPVPQAVRPLQTRPQPGQPLPPGNLPAAGQLPRPGGPVPPGSIPQQAAEPRRAPTQSFFPQGPTRAAPPRNDNPYTSN
jgi:hypothetical protein